MLLVVYSSKLITAEWLGKNLDVKMGSNFLLKQNPENILLVLDLGVHVCNK